MIRLEIKNDINREAANISALSSGKIDKYQFLTVEEILYPDQRKVTEQVKFTYSPLAKALEKQTKTIEGSSKNHIKTIDNHEKQIFESNELIKYDFNIDRGSIPFEEQKNIWKTC